MGRPRKHRLDLPPRVYYRKGAYYFVNAEGRWIRLDSDYAKAMSAWAELIQAPQIVVTMNDLFDKYVLKILPNKAPRTQKDNHQELRYLRAVFGTMNVDALQPHHIAEYRDARTAKVRCNRELALLSHVMKYACEWGYRSDNPCGRGKVSRNKEVPRDRYVTDEELNAFMELCPQWLKLYIELKARLGLRQRDLLDLELGNLTPTKITLKIGKTQKVHTILRNPELDALISACQNESNALFVTRSGKKYTSQGFGAIWRRLMAKYVSAGGSRFTEHDIRGKVATDMDDPLAAQKLLGHKSLKMTEAYIKARSSEAVEALQRGPKQPLETA